MAQDSPMTPGTMHTTSDTSADAVAAEPTYKLVIDDNVVEKYQQRLRRKLMASST